jgi:hypothetical protein
VGVGGLDNKALQVDVDVDTAGRHGTAVPNTYWAVAYTVDNRRYKDGEGGGQRGAEARDKMEGRQALYLHLYFDSHWIALQSYFLVQKD